MNKQQRDYTINRIQQISQDKEFECECEKPSLNRHIRRAIASRVAKVKPAKHIIDFFESKMLDGERYRSDTADLTDLFEAPLSYKKAMDELAAEQKKHENANNKVKQYAQNLIDRIQLCEFEDGKEPIRLMEAYSPTK